MKYPSSSNCEWFLRVVTFLMVAGLLALPAVAATDAPAPSDDEAAQLTDAERAELTAILESSRAELLSRIGGLSDAAWAYKPAPEKWSISEVVEHLLIAEKLIVGRFDTYPANPSWAEATRGMDDKLRTVLPDRQNKLQAPEQVSPKGEMSRREIVDGYLAARATTLDYLRKADGPVKSLTREGPLGEMNIPQWVLLVGLHNKRHNEQILEVMADAGFPK